jgi:hypothetical protein
MVQLLCGLVGCCIPEHAIGDGRHALEACESEKSTAAVLKEFQ